MTKVLIVVDVQNDFISGSLPVPDGEEVAQRIRGLISEHRSDYDVIVTTQDWHIDPSAELVLSDQITVVSGELDPHWSNKPDFKNTWPVHGKAGTEGAELHEAIKYVAVENRFFKGHYSAAYSGFEGFDDDGSPLEPWLREHSIDEVDVVGLALDYCVKATALDAQKLGFKTSVLLPLTAAVSGEGYAQAVTELEEAGVKLS